MFNLLSKAITILVLWLGYFSLVQSHTKEKHNPDTIVKTRPARLLSLGALVWVTLAVMQAYINSPY